MPITTERDLSPLYGHDDDPQMKKETQTFISRIDTFVDQRDQNDIDRSDPTILRDALDQYEALMADYLYGSREVAYWYLRDCTDGSPTTKQRLGQAEMLSQQQMIRLQFFELQLGQIEPDVQQSLLDSTELGLYRHYLERLRASAAHNLSRETEKAITLLSKPSYANRSDLIEDALKTQTGSITFDDGVVSDQSFEELMTLTKHTSKTIRDQAASHIHRIVGDLSYMATRELNSILEYKRITDTLRSYHRPDASRILSEDITPDVVDALIQAVSDSYDIARDFYHLKARLLGLKTLAYHERNLTISLTDDPEPTYSYDEALEIVRNVCKKMDQRFVSIFDEMSHGGRIDVCPRTGKRGGACNIGMGKNVINLVMLNYTDTLQDVTTLAHELGHAFHTQLVYDHQHALDSNYGMLTAEVSSQFLEDYVYEQLTHDISPTQELELLMTKLNDAISAIHRQIACYQYEQQIHTAYREEGFLDASHLSDIFQQSMAAYMGDAVRQDPGSELWRVYRSHIRTFFYVFSYAGAMILAKTLQSHIANGSISFSDIIDGHYSHGRDISPVQIFEGLGIDITDPGVWTLGLDQIRNQLHQAQKLADSLGY